MHSIEIEPSRPEESAPPPSILINANLANTFTFASHQNSIPVIRSIRIENATNEPVQDVQLKLTASPAFLRAKTWTIDRINAGDDVVLSDRRIDLDAAYLAGLTEAERGDITLRLVKGDKLLAEAIAPVRLLARDEWGGVADMGQLLPAFVMPNDSAIVQLLRSAAEKLATHGHSSALDGYQSNDPKRAYMLGASVYAAIANLGIHYAQPPASFERNGQKIRKPRAIVENRLATCLDTSVLFSAALEAAGLNSVAVMLDGHAITAVWLVKRTLPKTQETDITELRKAIAARELIAFETTGVTHRPPLTFEHAIRLGAEKLGDEAPQRFVSAIDIARSRASGIMPLASHDTSEGFDDGDVIESPDIGLPASPDFEMPADRAEEKPTTAAGRIARWQNRLLDLGLRNRLLNFSENKRTVSFLCTDIDYLEDRLAEGATVKIISLPEQNPLGERDAALYREVRGQDLHRGFATEALQRDELSSLLEPRELADRLIGLFRQTKSDLAEGGTNTLYLVAGVLRWKKKPEDEKVYRAPLLLLPVKLERTGASERFRLRFHEDEPRINSTLLQFLKLEFDLTLPDFHEGLPKDGSGVDVPQVLESMRRAVRDHPGFEVADDISLSTFSFAKYLMWKDLSERTDALRQNRVVKHLIDNPENMFPGAEQGFPDERDIDRLPPTTEIVMPLPADSSQIAAALAATQGRDFVIVGPPGTGKSQTIANMIASCLAAGKTVLFVAEKTAALDVVHRRLREHGLGDHCLELHSSKADRRHFFSQLRRSWEYQSKDTGAQWVTLNQRLRLRRDELNAYAEALHRKSANGLTPYVAMGVAAAGTDLHAPVLNWPGMETHDEWAYLELEELAHQLGVTFGAVTMRPVLQLIHVEEWTNAWQEKLLAAARSLRRSAADMKAALRKLSPRFGIAHVEDCRVDGLDHFAALAEDVIATSGTDNTVILQRDFASLRRSIDDLEKTIAAYRHGESSLSQRYTPEAVTRIPVDQLDQDWREANAAIWPKSWLGTRRVRRLLGSYAGTKAADPAKDLPLIRAMQAHYRSISDNALSKTPLAYLGLQTDCTQLRGHLQGAEKLRTSLVQLGEFAGDLKAVASSIVATLTGEINQAQLSDCQNYLTAYQAFGKARRDFEELAGHAIDDNTSESFLGQLRDEMDTLEQSRSLFRDWSSWCAVRVKANAAGLGPLVNDLETGALVPEGTLSAFRLGYARWWLPLAVDASAELRNFRRFQHETIIADFRDVDDLVRAHASQKVISSLVHGLPAAQLVPRNSELGRLRYQMGLQRPSASIREMIGTMPESFAKLAPCVLMSPLSIAQYLPTNQALFDVVIFDEASQIATWDAVGAIARGRQTIIVGDPKQLPPTNFFGRNDDDSDGVPQHEQDLESILDEAQASGMPTRELRWHYRSRHESLIAFSNWHYYGNNLVTFPSPVTQDQAVSFAFVPTGVYGRGSSRANPEEAHAIVADIHSRLKVWTLLPESDRPTLGVITFNLPQQKLILDLLDRLRSDNPDFEWFFSEDRVEPVIVKNLENIQGDERDVFLFSITYCRDAAGRLPMSFGAINNNGGERRLNVAVTRARRELKVFSGIRADDIDLNRSKAIGVAHLKAFLDYAVRGIIALPAQDTGSRGGFESPFEEAVAAMLEQRGWRVVPQIGVSGFRVDLGICHPDHAGIYLAGVECDGATYHSSATARDRDKLREQVLRGLGWTILRVWSTDWWFNTQEAAERLHEDLEKALADSRAARFNEDGNTKHNTAIDTGDDATLHPVEAADDINASDNLRDSIVMAQPKTPVTTLPRLGSALTAAPVATVTTANPAERNYSATDLSAFKVDPDLFFEFSYRSTLQGMVDAIIAHEAPLREDVLTQRIARAHGWLRTGGRIRDQIAQHLRRLERTQETAGVFLWQPGTVSSRFPFRRPQSDEHRRALSDICLPELVDFVLSHRLALDEADPPLVYARLLQLERLAASSRERLEEAIARAMTL
jgi:very-short-patch-repair endonuclease